MQSLALQMHENAYCKIVMDQAHSSAREYRADIDGLRAFAVLSVFIFHLKPDFLPGGFLGVDVFFVISGYLITGIILRKQYLRTFSFTHFYARRIKRIFPALFVVLIISGFIGTFLLVPETYVNFMKSGRYASAQLSNFFFADHVGYFEEGFSGQPLLHTWSLGVEEQFYLFWPLLIFICFRFFRKSYHTDGGCHSSGLSSSLRPDRSGAEHTQQNINRQIAVVFLICSLISFSACYILVKKDYNLAFYMFYSRAIEFCIGGFIALKVAPVPRTKATNSLLGLTGLLLLCYSVIFISEDYLGRSFLPFAVIIPCAGTALIIHAHSKEGIINRMLATKVPAAIGRISYSLYLYHWPVIIFWKLFSNTNELGIADSLLIIIVSFGCATLSYLLVEQPARNAGFRDQRVLIAALLLIVVFSSSFRILEDFETAPWRITRYGNEQEIVPQEYDPQCQLTLRNGLQVFTCQQTSKPTPPVIALVGDSHSPHFLYATTAWARKNGYNVKYLGTSGCPMLLGDVHIQSTINDQHEQNCEAALPLFRTEVVEDPSVKLVLIAQRFDLFYDGKGYLNTTRAVIFKDGKGRVMRDHTGYYEDQLSSTVEEIKKAGKKVVILKQVPLMASEEACDWQPRLKKWFSQERVCQYDTKFIDKWQRPSIDFIDSFTKSHQVDVFDPFPYFDGPLQNGINIYRDQDHLNEFGFQFLVPYFAQAMDEIMNKKRATLLPFLSKNDHPFQR